MSSDVYGLTATAPTPGALHDWEGVEAIAYMLGARLLPWQRRVARIATELNGRGDGWRWPIVYVSVPRQCGKTWLFSQFLPVHRAITGRLNGEPLAGFFTAQTGKDAGERWADLVKRVNSSELAKLDPSAIGVRRQAGTQHLELGPLGSQLRPFPPTQNSLHGYTPPLVGIDEGMAFDAARGNALSAAILPAQQTLTDRQLWIYSTRGNTESAWLREWDDAALAAVNDPASRLACIVHALPLDADPYDPDAIARFHPGVVGGTVEIDTLMEHSRVMPREEWERAYCNRWTAPSSQLLDVTNWERLRGNLTPPARTVAIAYEIAPDRSSAALVAVWHDTTTNTDQIKVVKTAPGIAWIPAAIAEFRAATPAKHVIVGADDAGANRIMTDRLIRDGHTIKTLNAAEFATATGAFLWSAEVRSLRHDGSPAMRRAVELATSKPLNDAVAFSRRGALEPINPLIAAAVALRLVSLEPQPIDIKPLIRG